MKSSDYIARFIEAQGITTVFELVGGMITHLLDSFSTQTKVKIVSTHHEQAAGFAAEGFGRVTGLPGVALATSGPGATNLLTAIGSCYFDSVPAIFITGQVNRHELKGDSGVRQLGFQETDIVSMARPITKWAVAIEEVSELERVLSKAFEMTTGNRPGPVLIDIPMDIQRTKYTFKTPVKIAHNSHFKQSSQILDELRMALAAAKRPLILAGGGVRASHSADEFRELVRLTGLPVVHSLMGVDLLHYEHPERVGLIGSYGNRWANAALAASDLLLVMGSRLDIRQTGVRTDLFKADRTIYHIDCDYNEINNRIKDCRYEEIDLKCFIQSFLENLNQTPLSLDLNNWADEIAEMKRRWPDTTELQTGLDINPNELMHAISQCAKKSSAIVADVGQHQMWAAQSLEIQENQRFLTSGGMGAMGFALPAAIGAAYAKPGQSVTMIAGDGGFQLNIQELQTVFRNRLPIKMIILNNQCHGMVRQFQESYFEARYQSTQWGYSAPVFANIATAYGIESDRVLNAAELNSALKSAFADDSKPYLLEVAINPALNAYPKMAFGRPLNEMEPDFIPLDMEGT